MGEFSDSRNDEIEGMLESHPAKTIEFNDRKWEFDAMALAHPYQISTHLTAEGSENRYDFWLDWNRDMRDTPAPRMHMYLGTDRNVPFEIKLQRMQNWAEAIQLYDSLMIDQEEPLTKAKIDAMIANGTLPRPERVALDTGSHGLRKLFHTLHFPTVVNDKIPEEYRPFIPPWKDFVATAASGDLVNTWRELKGQ